MKLLDERREEVYISPPDFSSFANVTETSLNRLDKRIAETSKIINFIFEVMVSKVDSTLVCKHKIYNWCQVSLYQDNKAILSFYNGSVKYENNIRESCFIQPFTAPVKIYDALISSDKETLDFAYLFLFRNYEKTTNNKSKK